MSLSDITQFIGISSVPVVVAGTVLGVFELGEKLTSQRAKDALSKWLLTFDVQKAKALPDGTQELFERIFGERHFSLKCFVRSAVFSLGAMALIGFLIFLIYPQEFFKLIDPYFGRDTSVLRIAPAVLWTQFAVWLPLSILIDYASLFKIGRKSAGRRRV